MVETKILLKTVTDVTNFVNLCSKCVDNILVYSGKYIVSGKSFMGLYSLNLSEV